jgi:hypothetical protein
MSAGALVRRHVRTGLLKAGLPYVENKGLLESDFIVTCSDAQWLVIVREIARYNGVMDGAR